MGDFEDPVEREDLSRRVPHPPQFPWRYTDPWLAFTGYGTAAVIGAFVGGAIVSSGGYPSWATLVGLLVGVGSGVWAWYSFLGLRARQIRESAEYKAWRRADRQDPDG